MIFKHIFRINFSNNHRILFVLLSKRIKVSLREILAQICVKLICSYFYCNSERMVQHIMFAIVIIYVRSVYTNMVAKVCALYTIMSSNILTLYEQLHTHIYTGIILHSFGVVGFLLLPPATSFALLYAKHNLLYTWTFAYARMFIFSQAICFSAAKV